MGTASSGKQQAKEQGDMDYVVQQFWGMQIGHHNPAYLEIFKVGNGHCSLIGVVIRVGQGPWTLKVLEVSRVGDMRNGLHSPAAPGNGNRHSSPTDLQSLMAWEMALWLNISVNHQDETWAL